MIRPLLPIAIGALTFLPASTARGVTFGWADQFLEGVVDCNGDSCGSFHEWDPNFWSGLGEPTPAPTWAWIGQQGTTGKANSRGSVMVRFRHTNAAGTCAEVTAGIQRYSIYPAPADGTYCGVVNSSTYLGQSSQTYSSCGLPAGELRVNNRMLPTWDFQQDTGGAGDRGYYSAITEAQPGGTSVQHGCYKIHWF